MKTKLFKRLGATVLALGMALSVMAIPTSAAITENSGSITVNNLESGAVVSIYQLTTVNYDYTADQPVDPVHKWVSTEDSSDTDVASWVTANYNNGTTDYINDNQTVNTTNFVFDADTNKYEPFYSDLAEAIANNEVAVVAAKTATVEENETSASFTELAMGNYLIIVSSGEGNVKVYRPTAVNVAPVYSNGAWTVSNPTVDIKSSTPPAPEKTTDKEDGSIQIGDSINYTITYDLNNLVYPSNATDKKFMVGDTLSDELNLNGGSIRVYGVKDDAETQLTGGIDLATESVSYILTVSGNTFTVDFAYDKVAEYDSIIIRYSAVVNENAADGSVNNTAKVTYNPNPYDENTHDTDTTVVDNYTYGIEVTKQDQSSDVVLPGAQFTLTADGEETAMKFVPMTNAEGIAIAGEYRVATADEVTASEILTTNDNGKIIINGLKLGTYILTETKAPDGYILPSNPSKTIVIADSDSDGIANGSFDTVKVEEDEDRYVEGTVLNISEDEGVPTLPTTGGMGTILFTTVGLVLVGGAAILLVVMYKRKKEN